MHISQTVAFSKIIATLNALKTQGVHFKIVADGQEYGDLALAKSLNSKRKISTARKYGAVRNTYKPILEAMQPGDVVVIDTPDLPDLTTTQYGSNISAWCTSNWGKGSHLISQTKDAKGIEVMRVA